MFGVKGKLVKNKRKCQEGKTRRSEIHVINVRCGKLGKIYRSGFGDGIQQLCGASAGISTVAVETGIRSDDRASGGSLPQ